MAREYIIRSWYLTEWEQGQAVAAKLRSVTRALAGRPYLPVHGDPILSQLGDRDLLCYFVYTLSSWWEIPLIDRINADRLDNNFAIIMDINPAPETMYRLISREARNPEFRYKAGLKAIFPSIRADAADAMYSLLRNGFGHNLFGREPGKIYFDNDFACPPIVDNDRFLLVPPIQLAISMITAFLSKISTLRLDLTKESADVFRHYMAGSGARLSAAR